MRFLNKLFNDHLCWLINTWKWNLGFGLRFSSLNCLILSVPVNCNSAVMINFMKYKGYSWLPFPSLPIYPPNKVYLRMTFLNSRICGIDRVAKSVVHELIVIESQQCPAIKHCMCKQNGAAVHVIFEPLKGVGRIRAVSYRYGILQHRSWNLIFVLIKPVRTKVEEGVFRGRKNEATAKNSCWQNKIQYRYSANS